MAELEPRLFSFNNPAGACPGCDGLGVRQFFDPDRVVRHPQLSVAGGAIRGWDRRNTYYFQMMQALGAHYDFDLETPYEKLPERIQRILLQGSGGEEIQFRYLTGRGTTVTRRHAFEGILPNLERRYRETESTVVRDELAKYLSYQPCPDCGGSRLNAAARNVFVQGRSLPEVDEPVGEPGARVLRAAGRSPAGAARSPPASSRKSAAACDSWPTSASST